MKWLMVAIIVGSTVLGRPAAKFRDEAARGAGRGSASRPVGRNAAAAWLQRGPLVLAVFFMAISFFAFMKLLSVADFSFAVPVTAASVALETVLARLVLQRKSDGVCDGRARSRWPAESRCSRCDLLIASSLASAAGLYQLIAILAVLSATAATARPPIREILPVSILKPVYGKDAGF